MLQPLFKFRPHKSNIEDLEAISVACEPLIQDILKRLKSWEPGDSRQHYLFIGPRGIGKTHILLLVQNRIIKNKVLYKKWYPLLLPEEAYSITRISDLLITSLEILSNETENEKIKEIYNAVKYDDDDKRVKDLCLDAFRHFHKSTGRGILLMFENVNRMFEKQIKNRLDIHYLRTVLTEEEWLAAICTSPTFLSSVTDPAKPLFEFFEVKVIRELSPEEQQDMFYKMAKRNDNENVKENIKQYKSRLRALYHFTGGNPRLTVMLYDLVAHHAVAKVTGELDYLLDQITPFYQDRMKEISEQEAQILTKMALLHEGCTPTELAKEVRLPAKTVRSLLARLLKSGYVRAETRRKKQTIYIIPERFFRIWHLMNHSRAMRGMVQYLLEFFSTWYATKEERDMVWRELVQKFQSVLMEKDEKRLKDLTECMKYISEISKGDERIDREFDRLEQMVRLEPLKTIEEELIMLDKEFSTNSYYYSKKGFFLGFKLNTQDKALKAFHQAIKQNPDDIASRIRLLNYLDFIEELNAAKNESQKIIQLISQAKNIETSTYISELLNDLFNEENEYSRYISSILLGYLVNKDIVKRIISSLNKINYKTDIPEIANVLGYYNSPIVIKPLIRLLINSKSQNRWICVRAIEIFLKNNIQNESVQNKLEKLTDYVEPLINLLNDESSIVRAISAYILGLIGSDKTEHPLLYCLRDSNEFLRFRAVKSLITCASENSQKQLIDILSDNNEKIRLAGAIALLRLMVEKDIPFIPKVLKVLAETKDYENRIIVFEVIKHSIITSFNHGKLEYITEFLNCFSKYSNESDNFFKPHKIALKYLQSNRDPAILERQHPEMREAVQLLVDSYDEGAAKKKVKNNEN